MTSHLHVELLSQFIEYETNNPGATIDEFCRSRLLKQEKKFKGKLVGGMLPPDIGTLLIKVIYRLGRLSYLFSESVLSDLVISTFEEFSLLNAIYALKSPRKSEASLLTLTEYTTGVDIINRLKKKNLVVETDDVNDKRSKKISISKAGLTTLKTCYERFALVNKAMLGDMAEQDKHLCIHILQDIEIRCSAMYNEQRGLPGDVILAAIAIK